MEDIEIDIRPIIRAVVRAWRLIVGMAVAVGMIAWGVAFVQSPTYTADAQIAIVQQDTQVDLKSNIKDQPSVVDPETLRTSLQVLAANGSVVQEVVTTLGNKLSPGLRDVQQLQKHVVLDAKGNTNVLQVHATSTNPDEAALIANTWTGAYVKVANTALAKHSTSPDLSAQLDQARANYIAKQQALATSPLPQNVLRLRRQVGELDASLASLRDARLKTISDTLAAQAKAQAALLTRYSTNAWTGQLAALETARQGQIAQITNLYSSTIRLSLLRDDVLALKAQTEKGSTSGSGLAYNLLKAQLFAGSAELPGQLQIQTALPDTPTVSDLDALVATTDDHLKSTRDQIAALAAVLRQGSAPELLPIEPPKAAQNSQDLLAQSGTANILSNAVAAQTSALLSDPKMEELEATYQKYAAQLDQQQQQLYVLTQERDLAKTNYTSLSTRSTELQVANATNDAAVVRVAGQGIVSGVSHRTLSNALIASLATVVLATLFFIVRGILAPLLREPVPMVPARVMQNE